ncbi:JAB domain-containing protein [Bacillus toyonensis]|uniref:JAB domain-containing protein n=1 Tax=Bacillus toyonensis TaxID=155322 RepID=UPI00124BE792|nr:JAB domain-containing protein [Bacillus toyonensis]KAB2357034.1 DNA repair protein RadC [Bacillus toyonensis]
MILGHFQVEHVLFHTSHDPIQSHEDIEVTKRLKEYGNIIGIPLLNHIIIGDSSYLSLMKKGII